ncbi:MAG: hybrid sensor histidine kinase/response regulator [Deltaproteobacteria bacterium]|nr:hybrid sensor histidine kinase/response regulator [Deltaproteobacteria bacterium]
MARIMIVDDDRRNRELLVVFIEHLGHELHLADGGERALAIANVHRPDLVLLDVMMPGIDGYETTRRLKAAAAPEFLPVILVTALHDRESRMKGLSAGADEFLTKPVDRHELMLRMTNLLAMREKTMALAQSNAQLIELQTFREEMSTLIVHDLKNPLAVVLMNLEYLAESLPNLPEEVAGALQDSRGATKRVLRLVANLLDLVRLEAGRLELALEPVDVSAMLAELVAQRATLARSRRIAVAVTPAAPVTVMADPDMIARMFENVFDNAMRHTPAGGRIEATATGDGTTAEISIGNSGPAIPLVSREKIFEKYGQAGKGTGRMNLGLGLYFCRMVAEAHRGRLWVDETVELPTLFRLSLPVR